MRYFTRKDLAPCLCNAGWTLLVVVSLFLLNAALIMSYSYAVNGLSYNMSTGCLLTPPPSSLACNQTLTFYARSGLGHLAGWSTALSLAELALLLIMLGVGKFILNYCREGYEDYRLAMVGEMPRTPSTTVSYMDDFSIDGHLSEDDSDSL